MPQGLAMELGPKEPWFVLQVRPRHEQMTALHLRAKGYEEFLPLYKTTRVWSDRKKQVEMSLFPGYLFCRASPQLAGRMIGTPGVIRIVGRGQTPVPIPEIEIENIRTILKSQLAASQHPYLCCGQTVELTHGPLRGVRGIVTEVGADRILVVSVNLLQRSLAVRVPCDWIDPV